MVPNTLPITVLTCLYSGIAGFMKHTEDQMDLAALVHLLATVEFLCQGEIFASSLIASVVITLWWYQPVE